jgi:hypothetical protein
MKDPSGTKQLTCSAKTGTTVIAAAVKALKDFKNPYVTTAAAVDSTKTSSNAGYVTMSASGNEITIVTCFTDGVASSETSCPTGSGGEVNTKTSKLLVE